MPLPLFKNFKVRLLDETGQELLYSGIVSIDEMHRNGNIIYGTYNFTNLEVNK